VSKKIYTLEEAEQIVIDNFHAHGYRKITGYALTSMTFLTLSCLDEEITLETYYRKIKKAFKRLDRDLADGVQSMLCLEQIEEVQS